MFGCCHVAQGMAFMQVSRILWDTSCMKKHRSKGRLSCPTSADIAMLSLQYPNITRPRETSTTQFSHAIATIGPLRVAPALKQKKLEQHQIETRSDPTEGVSYAMNAVDKPCLSLSLFREWRESM